MRELDLTIVFSGTAFSYGSFATTWLPRVRLTCADSRHWSIGLRCLYFAGPLSLWLFGGLWLLLGVAAWIPAMWGLDHMPPDVGALAAPQGGASDDAGADTCSGGGGGGGGGGGKRAVAAGAAAGFVAAAGGTRLLDGGAV